MQNAERITLWMIAVISHDIQYVMVYFYFDEDII